MEPQGLKGRRYVLFDGHMNFPSCKALSGVILPECSTPKFYVLILEKVVRLPELSHPVSVSCKVKTECLQSHSKQWFIWNL